MKLSWHATGTRVFETGVDRGVLYLSGKPGVPWNGLVSVSESKSGGDAKPYYVDGVKYLNLSTAEEYAATITALSAPDEFMACNGSSSVLNGLFADQQPRKQFGFSYRSKIGNDSFGVDFGYKIHLVYNALAGPATRDYKTTSNTPEAMQLSWDVTTIPEYLSGFKPTAHFVVDSTKTDAIVLGYLESILYGTAQNDPRLPNPTELKTMFGYVPSRPISGPINILGEITSAVQKITNKLTNPSFETPGATVVVRTNLVRDPAGTATAPWLQNPGTGGAVTLSAVSGLPAPFTKTTGIRVTWTQATTAVNGGVRSELIPGTAGAAYSFSVDVSSSIDQKLYARIEFSDASNGQLPATGQTGPVVPVSAGAVTRLTLPNVVAPANTANIRVMVYAANGGVVWPVGAKLTATAWLLEASPTAGAYFDGETQPVLRTNLLYNPAMLTTTEWGFGGGVTTTGTPDGLQVDITSAQAAGASMLFNNSQPAFGAGDTAVGSFTSVTVPVGFPAVTVTAKTCIYGSTQVDGVGPAVTINPGETKAVPTAVATGVSGSTGARIIISPSGGSIPVGARFIVKNAILEKASALGPYFDGASTKPGFSYAFTGTANASPSIEWDADFSTRWQGTANASASELTGVQPAGIKAATRVRAILSTRWSLTGTKSLRLIANDVSSDSFVSFNVPTIARNITLTSIATSYMEVGVAGGTGNGPRVRTVIPDLSGGLRTPGLVGTQEQRLTSSVTASPWELRLMHGGVSGSPDVWWDLSAIIDADYSGPSFDGDTPMFIYKNVESTPVWDGGANVSTSHIEYYDEFLNPANQGDAYIIGSNLWIYNAGVWGNYGPPPLVFRDTYTLRGSFPAMGAQMNPFDTSTYPGVTASAMPVESAPSWFSSGQGYLWSNSSAFNFHTGTPIDAGASYGCGMRGTGANNQTSIVASYIVNSPKFAIMVTSWAPTDISVWVDRKPVTVNSDPLVTTAAGYQIAVVDNLGSGNHQVDMVVGAGSNFLQVVVPSGSTVVRGPSPVGKLGLMGDSYTDMGLPPYFGGLARELFRLTGWSIVQLGQGSTGYTNNGSSSGDASKSVYGSTSRLNALTAANVNALFVLGSVNDGGVLSTTLQTAVQDYLTKVRTTNPYIPVIVAGVESLNLATDSGSDWNRINFDVCDTAARQPNVVGVIDWRSQRWLTGTGSMSSPKGDGNQDTYIGTADGLDVIHPNFAGQKYLAGKFVNEMKNFSTTIFPAGSHGDAYVIGSNLWIYDTNRWKNFGPAPQTS